MFKSEAPELGILLVEELYKQPDFYSLINLASRDGLWDVFDTMGRYRGLFNRAVNMVKIAREHLIGATAFDEPELPPIVLTSNEFGVYAKRSLEQADAHWMINTLHKLFGNREIINGFVGAYLKPQRKDTDI